MRTLMTEELVSVSGGWPEPIPPENCNNGWGNGESCAPGNSLANQPKFEDDDTGTSPSGSPASGGNDR